MKALLLSIIVLCGCEIQNDDLVKLSVLQYVNDQKNYMLHYGDHHFGPSPSILFLGDSRVDLINIPDYVDNESHNYAKNGSQSIDVINNTLPIALNIKPDVVVISIGINDLCSGVSHEDFLSNMDIIIHKIKEITPRLYITGVVPTNYFKTTINAEIKGLCAFHDVVFIDLSVMETSDGYLQDDLAFDGIHYNPTGKYIFMNEIIKSFVP